MAIAPQRTAIGIGGHFTTEGVHPYDEVVWERRDSRITDYRDGSASPSSSSASRSPPPGA